MERPVFKVIIAGTRTFEDYPKLCSYCDLMLFEYRRKGDIEIVCGRSKGPDELGERYAKDRGYGIKYFVPDWMKFGKKAGPLRNEQMAIYADAAIIFWNGKSKGSQSMINLAYRYNLKVNVFKYTEKPSLNDRISAGYTGL